MKKLLHFFVALSFLVPSSVSAAIFSSSPKILQESSKDVKIIFNAAESGKTNLKNASTLYAHIGVTFESAPSTWEYVKGDWTSNTADKRFTKRADGLWELNIGDIHTYFGIPSSTEKIAKIAVIARLASTSSSADQTDDFFLDVAPEGYQMTLSHDASSLVLNSQATINFTVDVTEPSDINITINDTPLANATNITELSKAYTFNQKGTYNTIKATATNGSETLTQTVTVAYPQPSTQANYPGGVPIQGAVKNADGTVTFCLAAPQKSSVILIPSWDNYQTLEKNVMKYQDYNGIRYFWCTTSEKLNDNEYYPYYYLVDGTRKVSDPYAKLVLDCYSDKWIPTGCFEDMPQYPYDKFDDIMLAVYRGDIDDYDWDESTTNFQIPNHQSLTIYELLLRDFTGDGSDTNGKNYGTFRTALPKVQYLADLGINAVELLPVMEFNGNSSWGYNTNFYMALDKVYGSPTDMRDFISECHRNGIAVILDIVFNQSDGLHPWYQMYDIASNPFYNQDAPHNYSVLNDWNQDFPLVTQHWKDVLKYWMQAYKVDGFRFDLVKGLGSNASYGSNKNTDSYNESRVQKMKELHAAITAINPNGIHINELLGEASEDKAMGADGQLNWNKVSNSAYEYAAGNTNNYSADTRGFYAANWSRVVGQTVDYAESHDEKRVARHIKEVGHANVKYTSTPKSQTVQRLGALATQMLLCPGAKMIWQFGELAADDEQGNDLNKLRAIAPKWDHLDVQTRAALHQTYKELCHLRLNNPEMFTSETTCILNGYSNELSSPRTIRLTNGKKEIIAFINANSYGSGNQTVSATATMLNQSNCQLISAAYNTNPTLTDSGSTVSVALPANGFAVFATEAVTGVNDIESDTNTANVSVSTKSGKIVINGEYTSAEVYNFQGLRFPSLEVPAGLYIVRVDGTPFKVHVK